MRLALTFLWLLVGVVPVYADAAALKEARQRWLRGSYAEARELYSKLAKDDKLRSAAAIGVSKAWRSEGDYDKAFETLNAALKDEPKNADLQAAQADVHWQRGRWEDADKSARAALAANPEQFLAHWVLAQLYRAQGDSKKAEQELVWFVRIYAKRSDDEKDITDPDELLLVGLAALERARWDPRLADQYQFVLTEIYGEIAKLDKDYWPAQLHSGLLFQEKYNHARAQKYFTKALEINPRAVEVLTARGMVALQRYEMKDAEMYADQALKINAAYVPALCLKADVFLSAGDSTVAMQYLDRAYKLNPRDYATLGRIAACHYLQRQEAALAALVKSVEQLNARPGAFYLVLAERLDERKRYDAAEKYFKLAMQTAPQLVAPRHELGMLYMRMGREEEARPILEKSFSDDEFHVRVFNTLKVLDHLKGYATVETKHFVLRYDASNDKVLAQFAAKYLEDIYAELAAQFKYEPPGPILVQLFSTHEMFSGRVVALPDLHTIGASTGRIIAMASPRDKAGIIAKPFNWNRVLRHELVHVFNLEQTHFQCPHWFTEGLAVKAEALPMPPSWLEILRRRVPARELHNLDNIHLGFIRPGSSEDWHLAYLQSLQYVEYLRQTYGADAVAGMLAAYRDGLDTGAALQKVCKVAKTDFEQGYLAHLQELVKTLGGQTADKARTFKELKEAHARDAEDADVAAALAEQYLKLRQDEEARQLAEGVLARQARHPRASYVKALLLLDRNDKAAARTLLDTSLDRVKPYPQALRLLGKLHFEEKQFDEAAKMFELGRTAEPYEAYWLTQLARCYRQTDASAKLIETLKLLIPTNADDLDSRRQLAKLLALAKQHAAAEHYAREALEIDVLDTDAQGILLAALRAQNKERELREYQKLLGQGEN